MEEEDGNGSFNNGGRGERKKNTDTTRLKKEFEVGSIEILKEKRQQRKTITGEEGAMGNNMKGRNGDQLHWSMLCTRCILFSLIASIQFS